MFANIIHIMPLHTNLDPLSRAIRTISYSVACYVGLYLALRYLAEDIIKRLPPIANALNFMYHFFWIIVLIDLVGYIVIFIWQFGLAELPLIGRFFTKPNRPLQGGGNNLPNFSTEKHEFIDDNIDNHYEDFYEVSESSEHNNNEMNVINTPLQSDEPEPKLSHDGHDSYDEPIIEENIDDDVQSQQLIYINDNDYTDHSYMQNDNQEEYLDNTQYLDNNIPYSNNNIPYSDINNSAKLNANNQGHLDNNNPAKLDANNQEYPDDNSQEYLDSMDDQDNIAEGDSYMSNHDEYTGSEYDDE
jgi:hypothetical protein